MGNRMAPFCFPTTNSEMQAISFLLISSLVLLYITVPVLTTTKSTIARKAFPHLRRPIILSHRGSRCLRPENTIDTFHTALQIGGHVLEFDVRLTKDNVLVVYHDDLVDRLTNATGFVRQHTLNELQALDAAYHFIQDGNADSTYLYRGKGVQIPTLRQVLLEFWGAPERVINNNGQQSVLISMNIEIKDNENLAVDKLIEELSRYGLKNVRNHVSIISRFCSVLNYFRQRTASDDIPTAACEGEATKFFLTNKLRSFVSSVTFSNNFIDHLLFGQSKPVYSSLQVPYYTAGVPLFSDNFIQHAHDQGSEVHYWVVNTRSMMEQLIKMGADAIITDRTDLAVQLLKEWNMYHEAKHEIPDHAKPPLFNYHVPLRDHMESHDCVTIMCLIIQNMGKFVSLCLIIATVVGYQFIYFCMSCLSAGRKIQKSKAD